MSYNSLHGLGSHSADADTISDLLMDDNAASTTLTDRSGNGNDATHWQDTSSSAGPGNGWFTRSMEYNGTTSYSKLSTASISLTDLSMSAWVRVRSTAADGAVFGQFSNNTTSLKSWLAWSDVGGSGVGFAGATVKANSTASDGTDNTDNQLNTWKHVTAVVDDGLFTLYVDGVQTATNNIGTPRNICAFPVTLGVNYSNIDTVYNRQLVGDIGPNVLMNRVWTAAEVAEDYAGPEPLNLTVPVVSGTHETGETLTATDGTWDSQANGTVTYTYQWQTATDAIGTGLTDIKGATASTWKLRSAQSGLYVRCLVSASNDGGVDEAEDTGSAWTLASGNALPSYNETFGLGTHSPDADLQGWWKLDDNAASTVVTDYSSGGNDGVASANTDTLQTGSGPPWQPSGFTFPSGEQVTITDSMILDGTNPFTICFWARLPSGANGNAYLGRTGSNIAARSRTRQVEHLLNTLGTNDRVRSTSTLSDGTWDACATSWGGVGGDIGSSVGGEPFNTLPTSGNHSNVGGLRLGTGVNVDSSNYSYFTRVLTSDEVANVASGPEPLNLTAPVVSGTHETGETLTATDGTWDSQANGTVTYVRQWQRADDASGTNTADISGATASTYTLTASDENKYVRFTIAASNDGGNDSAEDQETAWVQSTAGGGGPTFQPAWAFQATVVAL